MEFLGGSLCTLFAYFVASISPHSARTQGSTPGSITALHYDTSANIYVQLSGRKHFLLVGSCDLGKLDFFPGIHPHDRQSRLSIPSLLQLHNEEPLELYSVTLEPGDVLFIVSAMFDMHTIAHL